MPARPTPAGGNGAARYLLLVLGLLYAVSFVDRLALNLLVDPIRRDLSISDTEMSYLIGLTFVAFYTLAGVALGRLADTRDRRRLIVAGVVVWSAMTLSSGLAATYWQLLLFRTGVGLGEAALSPAAYSLIADSFPRREHGTVLSLYSMAIYVGSGLSFVLGGVVLGAVGPDGWDLPLLGHVRPWQAVFFVVGTPGLFLAPLLLLVREPARQEAAPALLASASRAQLGAFLRRHRRLITCHNGGFAFFCLAGYASSAWVPTMLVRRHALSTSEAGLWYGAISAICGGLGILCGGKLADWLRRRRWPDANMRVGLIACLAWMPAGLSYPLLDDWRVVLPLVAVSTFMLSLPWGAAVAALVEVAPNALRSRLSALYLFTINLVGMGAGPTAVALVTDSVIGDPMGVHVSLVVVTLASTVIAAGLLRAGLAPMRAAVAPAAPVVGLATASGGGRP